jgi:hypothetical protein
VPPFPPRLEWVGERPPPVERLCALGPLLVHFLCALDLNSVRTVPYLVAWHERYASRGLTVLGIDSPRFAPSGERDKLVAALARLEIRFPVAIDAEYRAWRAYGCRGWPSLFLWGLGGALQWFHFGEGEYQATEEQIAALVADGEQMEPLAPLRPGDAPGARVIPPTPEVFPGGSPSQPWSAATGEERLTVEYDAGGAAVSMDGRGELRWSIDDEPQAPISIDAPGVYELGSHPRHGRHRLELRPSSGLSVYSIGFPAGVP